MFVEDFIAPVAATASVGGATRLCVGLAVSILLVGCGIDRRGPAARPESLVSSRAPGGPRPACPPTGSWARCSVLERLDHAGLAPRLDSAHVQEESLTLPGSLVHLGNTKLEIFVYADPTARERDQARLDRSRYIDADTEPTMSTVATIISSANLLALLFSKNDHQRERVADAITAGAPQPHDP